MYRERLDSEYHRDQCWLCIDPIDRCGLWRLSKIWLFCVDGDERGRWYLWVIVRKGVGGGGGGGGRAVRGVTGVDMLLRSKANVWPKSSLDTWLSSEWPPVTIVYIMYICVERGSYYVNFEIKTLNSSCLVQNCTCDYGCRLYFGDRYVLCRLFYTLSRFVQHTLRGSRFLRRSVKRKEKKNKQIVDLEQNY